MGTGDKAEEAKLGRGWKERRERADASPKGDATLSQVADDGCPNAGLVQAPFWECL